MDEMKFSSESAPSDGGVNPSSSDSPSDKASADKEAEIKTLNGLSSELEKKASLFFSSGILHCKMALYQYSGVKYAS